MIKKQLSSISRNGWLLQGSLFILPWLVGSWWGLFLHDSVYDSLRHAHNLALGRGLAYDMLHGGHLPTLSSPLLTAVLVPLAWLNVPLETAVFLLSTLGWSIALVALVRLGKAQQRPLAGTIAAFLLGFSPLFIETMGLATSWLIAWLLLALGSTKAEDGKRPFTHPVYLSLFILTHFDITTLVLALLISLYPYKLPLHWPQLRTTLLLILVALGWAAVVGLQLGTASLFSTIIEPTSEPNLADLRQLWRESELYWLFVPFLLLGVWEWWQTTRAKHRSMVAILGLVVWLIVTYFAGSPAAVWLTAVLILALVALGTTSSKRWLPHRPESHHTLMTVLLGLVLLWPLLTSLQQRALFRSTAQRRVETHMAAWLQRNSLPTAVVWTSPRLAFLADRPRQETAVPSTPAQLPTLLAILDEAPPHYLITTQAANWDFLTSTGWFQERYAPAASFDEPLLTAAPYVVWAYQESLFDVGEKRPLAIETDRGVKLVAAQVAPARIQPGEQVHVTLQLEATRPISNAFNTVVRIIAPLDGIAWGQQDEIRPLSRPLSWWQPGQIITERFVITSTQDIPVGAYEINVSFHDSGETAFWPLSDGENELEAVGVGTTAVSWQGTFDTATPIAATFGDQIRLAAADYPSSAAVGETIDVTLYWEALRPPDASYTVFVHLVDAENQVVANHDGQPLNGRFPTGHWLTDETFGDSRPLTIPPDLPPGPYQIKIGLYLLETGERLPVWDQAGVEQPERSIPLPPFTIVD